MSNWRDGGVGGGMGIEEFKNAYEVVKQEQAWPTPATSTSSNYRSPTPRPRSKRNAAIAFSPMSASFSHLPAKRLLSEYTANTYSSSIFTPFIEDPTSVSPARY